MIGHYLPNNNENTTVFILQNFLHLNKASKKMQIWNSGIWVLGHRFPRRYSSEVFASELKRGLLVGGWRVHWSAPVFAIRLLAAAALLQPAASWFSGVRRQKHSSTDAPWRKESLLYLSGAWDPSFIVMVFYSQGGSDPVPGSRRKQGASRDQITDN